DECHRSAWGKWSQVLTRNPNAVQIGLTATPRQLRFVTGRAKPSVKSYIARGEEDDAKIIADNLHHFGAPVYEYDMAQGIEDGYLAACDILRRDIFLDQKAQSEQETGIEREDLEDKRLRDATTGEWLDSSAARKRYEAPDFEDKLLMPERVAAMTQDLFSHLLAAGGPEQKSIIFCASDQHCDRVAASLNNLYADWCTRNGRPRAEAYAFKCTASVGGADYIADLRGGSRHHFIATTVELLTTGVDVPVVRNIVFFKYVRSPIAFYQMVGRGTRLHPPTGKLMFRVYDYTGATRLFGHAFVGKLVAPKHKRGPGLEPIEPTIQVEGFDVHVTDAGRYILAQVDGKAMPVTVEEYRQRLAAKLVEEAPTLETFRSRWIAPAERQEMMGQLPDGGRSAALVRVLADMVEYDLYDVLAELGYGLAPRTRVERADAFTYKHEGWLSELPPGAAATLKALAGQFARAGTEGLENPQVFQTPEVVRAGGLSALRVIGRPADVLRETKERMFAA
ncbi:MAG: helicase-related protein, partial [Bacillota bacterium]|nr:helicase-related protein [Bacillota bacterium]